MNFGTFTQAKLPRVQGIENFEGEMFHTSRWNYEYTGGSSEGNLEKLGDKRVAIIGTVMPSRIPYMDLLQACFLDICR